VIRPTARFAGDEEPRQLQRGLLAQSDQIDRLAPHRPLFGAARRRHLADDTRQHAGGMLPADDVETLESLVDEIQRVSATGIDTVRLGREQEIRECQMQAGFEGR